MLSLPMNYVANIARFQIKGVRDRGPRTQQTGRQTSSRSGGIGQRTSCAVYHAHPSIYHLHIRVISANEYSHHMRHLKALQRFCDTFFFVEMDDGPLQQTIPDGIRI